MNIQLPRDFIAGAVISILFGVLPFAIYAVEILAGAVPTREAWVAGGFNHGPWRWEAEGFTILYPLLVLAPVTVVVSAVRAIQRRQVWALGAGLGLVVAQSSMAALQLYFLFWLID